MSKICATGGQRPVRLAENRLGSMACLRQQRGKEGLRGCVIQQVTHFDFDRPDQREMAVHILRF